MSAFFTNFKELMLGGGVHTLPDLQDGDIRFVCVDHADDTPVLATDQDLADLLVASRVATSAALASKAITGGAFDHADTTLSAVTGDQFESIVYYGFNATEALAPLICQIDSGTGLPFTPSGGDIIVRPNASGVFSL